MLRHLRTTGAVLLVLGACADGPIQPEAELLAPSLAKLPRISMCHLDADAGTYSALTVNGNAERAHRDHGDGQVGDPVPGREGYEFDENCQPAQTTVTISACLQDAIDGFENFFTLDFPDPETISWTEAIPGWLYYVAGGSTEPTQMRILASPGGYQCQVKLPAGSSGAVSALSSSTYPDDGPTLAYFDYLLSL